MTKGPTPTLRRVCEVWVRRWRSRFEKKRSIAKPLVKTNRVALLLTTHHGPIFQPRSETPRERIAVPSSRKPVSVLALTSTESNVEVFDGLGSDWKTNAPLVLVKPSAIDRSLSGSAAWAQRPRQRARRRERQRSMVFDFFARRRRKVCSTTKKSVG